VVEAAGACDALAVAGPELEAAEVEGLIAAGTSLLTGRVWSGRLLLLRPSSASLLSTAVTGVGNCDVCWLKGGRLATAGDDGGVRVWAVPQGEFPPPTTPDHDDDDRHNDQADLHLLEHDDAASCLAANADRLASGSWDTRLKVWDLAKQVSSTTLAGHVNVVHALHWAADSLATLLSASQDKSVKQWDLRQSEAVRTVALQAPVFTVCGHPSKPHLFAAGDEDGVVSLYDVRADTAQALHRFTDIHDDSVRRVCFSPQNPALLATASDDATVRVTDVETKAAIYCFDGHTDFVRGLAWDASGKTLVSGSWDKSIFTHTF